MSYNQRCLLGPGNAINWPGPGLLTVGHGGQGWPGIFHHTSLTLQVLTCMSETWTGCRWSQGYKFLQYLFGYQRFWVCFHGAGNMYQDGKWHFINFTAFKVLEIWNDIWLILNNDFRSQRGDYPMIVMSGAVTSDNYYLGIASQVNVQGIIIRRSEDTNQ